MCVCVNIGVCLYVCVLVCVCVCMCVCLNSQTLQVRIVNVEEYEKQESFFVVLEDPKWLKRGISGQCLSSTHACGLIVCIGFVVDGARHSPFTHVLVSYDSSKPVSHVPQPYCSTRVSRRDNNRTHLLHRRNSHRRVCFKGLICTSLF